MINLFVINREKPSSHSGFSLLITEALGKLPIDETGDRGGDERRV